MVIGAPLARPIAALLAGALAAAAGCSRSGGSGASGTASAAAARPAPVAAHGAVSLAADTADPRWADSVLAGMSLRDRAAQMVWPWILGDYVPEGSPAWDRIRRLVTEQRVGGFIMSVGSPLDVAEKANALQRLSGVPLLFSADLEAGAGFRFRGGHFLPNAIDLGGATVFPAQMALGAARDTALAYAQGRATAREGRALGIHIAYGPVLDVNNNPANPVINTRSFGEDPALVARLGAALVRGIQENGMLATGKHFPGHGDTETNSHLSLSTVTASRARLDSVELVPFRAAVDAGVGAMMTYHGILPALDSSGVPATLSPQVLTGLLRESLGFRGLVITDAMDMAGVVQQFGALDAAKRAVAAGAEVLLMPTDVPGTIDAVVAGVREGRYPESRVTDAARRILELKRRFALDRQRLVDLDGVRRVVGDPAHAGAVAQIAERSLVLVTDSLRQVPIRAAAGTAGGAGARAPRVLSITIARRADLAAGTAFDAELRRAYGARLRSEVVTIEGLADAHARLLAAADSADVTIVGSYIGIVADQSATSGAPRPLVELVQALGGRGRRPIVVSYGNPYLLREIPGTSAYMVAWSGIPASQQAAARALLGRIAITGTLPIAIPPVAPLGAGERRDVTARQ